MDTKRHFSWMLREVPAYQEMAQARSSSPGTGTIRLIEGLVAVLIRKKLLLLADLPRTAQRKRHATAKHAL